MILAKKVRIYPTKDKQKIGSVGTARFILIILSQNRKKIIKMVVNLLTTELSEKN